MVTLSGKPFKRSPRNEDIQVLLNYLSTLNATGKLTGFAFGVTLKSGTVRCGRNRVSSTMAMLLVGALESAKLGVLDDAVETDLPLLGRDPHAR